MGSSSVSGMNCSPTPPLTQDFAPSETQMLTLSLGRGRWAVSLNWPILRGVTYTMYHVVPQPHWCKKTLFAIKKLSGLCMLLNKRVLQVQGNINNNNNIILLYYIILIILMLQLSLSHKKFSGVVEGLILIHCSAILMGLVGGF